ncbi:hypothetical protein [Nocardia fluminea]|uniref:hypothetical protein n=1 Tax=Nocardia fluminea TaxID=134984 RepID=UPI003648510D
MVSLTLNFSDAVMVISVMLLCTVIWAAIFATDPDRREAAQRVLAIVARRQHIPGVRTQPEISADASRNKRRSRKPSKS